MIRWLNSFLIPRPRLNQYQLAGWTPNRIADSGLGCKLLADVMIPMQDGVHLSADVYTPAKSGKYPVILQFSAYNRDLHTTGLPSGNNEIGSPPVITDRGYVQVIVTARSIGRSEGTFQPWQNEQETQDHAHCIEWAAQQPWSNGDVCLFGTSYYGMNQASVAALNPPSLRAFFANEICTDFYRHLFHYGGVFNADFLNLWVGANFNPATVHRYIAPWKRALLSHLISYPWLWNKLIKPNLTKIIARFKKNHVIPKALRWYIHLMVDSNSREETQITQGPFQKLNQIHVPFVTVQNLGNIALHQFGCYDLFEHASTPQDKKWMILGPAEYELPVYSWQLEALAFFDHIVKGVDNGYADLPPVRYWVEGKNQFESAANFPIPEMQSHTLYLQKTSINLERRTLQHQIPDEDQDSWISIPPGAEVLPGIEQFETQKLAYELLFEQETTIAGPITLQLKYSCNEIDSYVIARLGKIDCEGNYRLLSMGHLRPATRTLDSSSTRCELAINTSMVTPLQPNIPVLLRFSMTPIASFFKKSERLLLEIASRCDQLYVSMNEGFIVPYTTVPPYYGRNKIYYGSESYIELPFKQEAH
ncbi:CocE/NonD family hydrolase [Fluoribacter gormanii]|uniref:CocE/NonD family hydrolase n=1 Tax=Fluoribacter gormanii TaxID=464 RepID=UPI002244B7D8|nr:CocE/NonD family hydrolase [Fluoribacter gormanii]MCW8471276.1 CocE/NonD family hydrolase [Fluoribacter gormanii]